MDILNVIVLIVAITLMIGMLIGWLIGYRDGYRKAAKEAHGFSDSGALKPGESYCIHCFATMPDHYHGCPIAAELKLFTIAKPGG